MLASLRVGYDFIVSASFLYRGQAIAQQIQNSNPNLVDQLTGFGGNPDGRPPPNGNNPDSSSNEDYYDT